MTSNNVATLEAISWRSQLIASRLRFLTLSCSPGSEGERAGYQTEQRYRSAI